MKDYSGIVAKLQFGTSLELYERLALIELINKSVSEAPVSEAPVSEAPEEPQSK